MALRARLILELATVGILVAIGASFWSADETLRSTHVLVASGAPKLGVLTDQRETSGCVLLGLEQRGGEMLFVMALRTRARTELTTVRILVAVGTSALGAAETLHTTLLFVASLAFQLRMRCAQGKTRLRMAQCIELRRRKMNSAMAVRTSLRSKLASMRVLVASGASLRCARRSRRFQTAGMALRACQTRMRSFECEATGRVLLDRHLRLSRSETLVLAAVAVGTT